MSEDHSKVCVNSELYDSHNAKYPTLLSVDSGKGLRLKYSGLQMNEPRSEPICHFVSCTVPFRRVKPSLRHLQLAGDDAKQR